MYPHLAESRAAPALRVQVIRSIAELQRHQPAYDAFVDRLPQTARLFYSLPWLETCSAVYLTPQRGMYFLLAWQGDHLVGVAPLQLEQKSLLRGRVRRVFCWGNVHGSFMLEGAFLVPEPAHVEPCIAAFAAHLLDRRSGAVDYFEFNYLHAPSPLFDAVQRHFPAQFDKEEHMPSYQMALPASFDAYAKTISGSTLSKVRNRWRALQKAGQVEFLPRSRLSEAELEEVMQLHAGRQEVLRERGRARQSVFRETTPRATYLKLLEQSAVDGSARHYLLKVDGHLVSFALGFHRGDTMIYHLVAFDPAWSRFEPGRVLLFLLIQAEIDGGQTRIIDALPGITKVKQDFSNAMRRYRSMAGVKPGSWRAAAKVGLWKAGVAAMERWRAWRDPAPESVPVHQADHAGDEPQPDAQPGDLGQRGAPGQAALQLRDQVGHGHVDEAAGRHHQQVRQGSLERPERVVPQHAADHRGQAGQGVQPQGT